MDALVNNAIHQRPTFEIESATDESMCGLFEVGALETAHFMQEVCPVMVANGTGSIINITSAPG